MARSTPQSKVSAQRAQLFKLMFANPISGLTPSRLIQYLNAFRRGELRQAALLWQEMMDRDDQIGPCATKRTRGVARLGWQVPPIDDSPEAGKHKNALTHFYNNLTAYDGLNTMERGGVRQLVKQMMTCIGMKYANHEIIWKPDAPGGLTADFKFLPLQFFENRTGQLRFLRTDYELYGADLDDYFGPGNYMCCAGDGLMFASSIAYLFKTPTGIKAWVSYMEKFGIPGLHGKTSAHKGTPEWDELVSALQNFGEDLAIVTNEGASISPIEGKSAGNAPHAPLVDRMDRAISRIWMGGDLATMAATGGAVGSQPQGDDLATLKEDDAAMITGALNEYVDTQVIRQLFGDVAPLAYFQLVIPKPKSTDESVKRIETGAKFGIPIAKSFVRQELNLPEPKDGDDLIEQPAGPVPAAPDPVQVQAANEAAATQRQQIFATQARATLSAAQASALKPLTDRLEEILGIDDETTQDAALIKLQADMPSLLKQISADPELIAAWESILGTALVSGAAEAAQGKLIPAANYLADQPRDDDGKWSAGASVPRINKRSKGTIDDMVHHLKQEGYHTDGLTKFDEQWNSSYDVTGPDGIKRRRTSKDISRFLQGIPFKK